MKPLDWLKVALIAAPLVGLMVWASLGSGLRPLTDALTGCQYLSRGDSLTPRLNASGGQICEARP